MHFSSFTAVVSSGLRAEPSDRLEFIKRQLGDHESVRLIITEAADARSERSAGPLAHALTIERNGKGYRVQDITVDADRNFTVGQHLITRHGRFVEVPGDGNVTKISELKALIRKAPPQPRDPALRYRDYSQQSLIDRLVVNEVITNDTKEIRPDRGIVVHKSEFDTYMRRAVSNLGEEVQTRLKANTFPHPFKALVDELLPLAKARSAQEQLAKTLAKTGLDGFTFSGNDMM
jgi:hypothetical protein